MSRFLFVLGGQWIILPSLVFKTALFTVIIIIKSAPSTATRSKIACVFGEGPGKLPSGMVVAKKIKKNQKNQKIQKIIKNYKKTWRPNIQVFAFQKFLLKIDFPVDFVQAVLILGDKNSKYLSFRHYH